ncbi:MAG: GNAT family N-acetyltransferase, partial [Myxococcota bacterium]
GIETLSAYRGRGLAPRVAAAWGRALREQGGEPLYSTSWDNKASRAVARKLGLVPYGEDISFS